MKYVILHSTVYLLIFSGALLLASCAQNTESNIVADDPFVVGGGVRNYAVLDEDTIYEGGWDTGLKSIKLSGDTVVYDCSHLFHGYYWRWCGDSLWLLDTNVFLIEVNRRINHVDSNFWCLSDFKIITERTDTSFQLSSSFYSGDTIFYQSSHWGLKEYWPVD